MSDFKHLKKYKNTNWNDLPKKIQFEIEFITDLFINNFNGVYLPTTGKCMSIDDWSRDQIKMIIIKYIHKLDELYEFSENCSKPPIKWSMDMKTYKNNFKFPDFNVEHKAVFDLPAFYKRYEFDIKANDVIEILKLLPHCGVTNNYLITKKNNEIILKNKPSLYKEILDFKMNCNNRFIIVPITLYFNKFSHAAAYIIDTEKGIVETYDPHGHVLNAWIDDFGAKIANVFQYTFSPLHQTCNKQGVQIIENNFDLIYYTKFSDSKFLEARRFKDMTGNCYLWIVIMLIARLSNPEMDKQQVQKNLYKWLDTKKALNVFENLYKILKY